MTAAVSASSCPAGSHRQARVADTTSNPEQSEATALLTAGPWTVFAGVGHISGGTATDQADPFYIAVFTTKATRHRLEPV